MVTFSVHPELKKETTINDWAEDPRPELKVLSDKIQDPPSLEYLKGKGEAPKEPNIIATSGREPLLLGSKTNSLVEAIFYAWNNHYPLVLSPDHFWITIAQGFAKHVELNAEELRHKFVQHEGKEHIEVFDSEVPALFNSKGYNWESILGVFSSKLQEKLGPKIHSLIVSDYSTTGPTELAVSEIVLMDAMKSYFTYGFTTSCGFPEITLLGTAEDYRKIKRKTAALSEYGLSWWTDNLLPVLDRIIETVESCGNLDIEETPSKPEYQKQGLLYVPPPVKDNRSLREFWETFFDYRGGSGSSYVSGWLVNFFPYVSTGSALKKNEFKGANLADFPSGFSKVPFVWNQNGLKLDMLFCGGFSGVKQDTTNLAVSPELGWAIVEVGPTKTP